MYAVIKTGGKQYRVREGDTLRVEKLSAEAGAKVQFDQVMMVGEGSEVKIGTPFLAGSQVSATVVGQGRSDKIKVVKFKRRKNYLRQTGHRQAFTEVEITKIGGATKAVAAKPEATSAAEPKAESKAEPQVESKAEPKAESKGEPQVESKAEPKAESKGEPQVESKAEPKVESKAEPKVESKAEPKVESKAKTETKPKAAPKPKAAAEPKAKAPAKAKAKAKAKPKTTK